MLELLISLNWWPILIATVIYFLLGALWYSPMLFAHTWMKLRGISEKDIGQPNPIIFLWAFILEGIGVTTLAVFLQAIGDLAAWQCALVGFGAGAGFVFSLTGTTAIFSDIKFPLHLIDNGYHVIALSISGLVLGWW